MASEYRNRGHPILIPLRNNQRGENMYYIYDENYLAHHQIEGGKWGVHRGPPYPLSRNSDGSLNAKKQAARKEKSSQSEEDIAAARKRRIKDEIVKNPKKLYKHRGELTKADVDEIMKEIDFDRKIKDIKRTEFQRNLQKLKDVADVANTVANVLNGGINTWNNTAMIYNAFYDAQVAAGKDMSGKKKMRILNKDKEKQNKN